MCTPHDNDNANINKHGLMFMKIKDSVEKVKKGLDAIQQQVGLNNTP